MTPGQQTALLRLALMVPTFGGFPLLAAWAYERSETFWIGFTTGAMWVVLLGLIGLLVWLDWSGRSRLTCSTCGAGYGINDRHVCGGTRAHL